MRMNKLMGFFELKELNVPSIPWKEFKEDTVLSNELLWTVRTAVFRGDDLNLPRKVGVNSKEAVEFGRSMLKKFNNTGMVIYYPYFIAEKSGNLNVFYDKIVIEAVKDDLWNLVSLSKRDVTIIESNGETRCFGDSLFLNPDEYEEIVKNVPAIKLAFRNELLTGRGVLLEWSFAKSCNVNREPVGQKYLVFYEVRTN